MKIDLSLFAAKSSAKAGKPLVEMTPAECREAAKVVDNARKGATTKRLVVKFGRSCLPIPLGNGQTADALQPKTAEDAAKITETLQTMISNGDFDQAFAAEQERLRNAAADAEARAAEAKAKQEAINAEQSGSEDSE